MGFKPFIYLIWLGWRDSNPRNNSVKDCCLYRLTTSQYILKWEDLVVGFNTNNSGVEDRRYVIGSLLQLFPTS